MTISNRLFNLLEKYSESIFCDTLLETPVEQSHKSPPKFLDTLKRSVCNRRLLLDAAGELTPVMTGRRDVDSIHRGYRCAFDSHHHNEIDVDYITSAV